VITIGVTGHRILAEVERIEAGIEQALEFIENAYPDQPLAVMSQIAEGADRMVANAVLARPGATLIVPLPLPPADYETDFETEESKREFRKLISQASEVIDLPPVESRNVAYEAAGVYVLDHCDVLLTIWDGQGAQGQGGTGEIVSLARQRGLPIAWIHAGNRKPGTLEPTSLGDGQGTVTFEDFQKSSKKCQLR
jgi:hypothetical protein